MDLGLSHGPKNALNELLTFSPSTSSKETASLRSRHASRHVRDAHDVMHVGIANPQWREKSSCHSRCMRNPQFGVSGKMSMVWFKPNHSSYSISFGTVIHIHFAVEDHFTAEVIFRGAKVGCGVGEYRELSFYYTYFLKKCSLYTPYNVIEVYNRVYS